MSLLLAMEKQALQFFFPDPLPVLLASCPLFFLILLQFQVSIANVSVHLKRFCSFFFNYLQLKVICRTLSCSFYCFFLAGLKSAPFVFWSLLNFFSVQENVQHFLLWMTPPLQGNTRRHWQMIIHLKIQNGHLSCVKAFL